MAMASRSVFQDFARSLIRKRSTGQVGTQAKQGCEDADSYCRLVSRAGLKSFVKWKLRFISIQNQEVECQGNKGSEQISEERWN